MSNLFNYKSYLTLHTTVKVRWVAKPTVKPVLNGTGGSLKREIIIVQIQCIYFLINKVRLKDSRQTDVVQYLISDHKMRSELKYPIAVDKVTEELRYAGDVKSGRDCDCYCKLCERNMIAINGGIKQRSHFRHEANSNCSASYESYIHWLTKEVFREISTLSLPDLSFLNLDIDFRRKLFQLFDQHNLPTFFRNQIKDYLIADINAKTKCFKIESVDIEKEIKTSNGKIRVDIVINFGNSKLFIEPYFKNPISHEKLKLIEEIGISTVSISLSEFVIRNNLTFSKEELIDFLSNNLQAKSWAYHKINPTSFAKNLDFVKKIIKDKASTLNIYATKEKEIVTIDSEITELTREQEKIFAIITEKRQHKEAIKKHLEDFDLGDID